MAKSRVGEVGQRPWGQYEVLWEGPGVLLKRLTIRKNEMISYQYHLKRSEVWTIVRGMGLLTLDGFDRLIAAGDTVTIGREVEHSIEATTTDLVIYEMQVGEPDEDDIVRLSDKYGRI